MPSVKPSPLEPIIWAVDPTEISTLADLNASHETLTLIAKKTGSLIQPVYVLRLNTAVTTGVGTRWRADLKKAAEKSLTDYADSTKMKFLTEPHVIVCEGTSIRMMAETLSRHAQLTGARLILTQTHCRTGISRAILGSFAETLTHYSKVPVLLISPKTNLSTHPLKNILFPTDFTRHAADSFRNVLALASLFKAKVILFHAIDTEPEPLSYSGLIGPTFSLASQRRDWELHFRRRAEHWIEFAKKRGVKAEFVLHDHTRDPAEDIIGLANAKEVDLVAMSSDTGPIEAALIGSTARKVIRAAECPIWILKPKAGEHPALTETSTYTSDR
jgi:nucleotide-binding universal stress UspA family protein